MKIINIPRASIHEFVSKFFTKKDGEFVMWLMGKDKKTKQSCIFAACGTKQEVHSWVDQVMQEKNKLVRKGNKEGEKC